MCTFNHDGHQANYKKDRQAIQDAYNAQNTYGEYLGIDFPEYQEDINIVVNNSGPQQQRQGWGNNNDQTTKVRT